MESWFVAPVFSTVRESSAWAVLPPMVKADVAPRTSLSVPLPPAPEEPMSMSKFDVCIVQPRLT
jgi:hypothetical protein